MSACLPDLLAGKANRMPQDLSKGAYFGGRKPEDGIIDWSRSAQEIHDLVRAVAPPYPGASTRLFGKPMRILQTLVAEEAARGSVPVFYVKQGKAYAVCGSGVLRVVHFELDGKEMSAEAFTAQYGAEKFEFNR